MLVGGRAVNASRNDASFFDRDFREMLSSQLVSLTGGLIAGSALAAYTDKLLLLPGMLIILPGFLEMRGNISSSFASRLSSGLFLRVINPDKVRSKIIEGNLLASFFLALFVSLVLGVIAFAFSYVFLATLYPKIILLPLLAGIIANAVEIPLTLFVTIYLFKKGHDPNNVMGPFVTSTGDITSIASLLIVLAVL
ncbi:MAG: magnesium transporter [Candidatus Norongarragalinales archaeon]